MPQRIGKYTTRLDSSPSVLGFAAIASKKEGEGPLAPYFDVICDDTAFGEQTWEKAESRMQKDAVNKALEKAGLSCAGIDYIFAGDLLNQCISSTYGLRDLGIPFFGLFGACSTMAESLCLSAMLVEGGLANTAAAVTSSHFCSAERQFRFPLEYGGQRTPTSQWTVTGAGAAIIGRKSVPPYLRALCIGTIEDMGVKDMNNMGAAMAPAAAATISRFFEDTCTGPDNYDLILTGDLGQVGSALLCELLCGKGYTLGEKHNDCGLMIYDRKKQDVHAGGSGCGCSASVLCSYVLPSIREGKLQDVLFIATGALMSPTSVQQGESIPGIAHLVHLSALPNPQQKGARH
ncbi:MAG: stage V sporulation protein AD [Provencibacterium sp.]|jgi:stage V sporulation protein AD|nr:stage V sporulation protein AD [Provencibacterium sp.]